MRIKQIMDTLAPVIATHYDAAPDEDGHQATAEDMLKAIRNALSAVPGSAQAEARKVYEGPVIPDKLAPQAAALALALNQAGEPLSGAQIGERAIELGALKTKQEPVRIFAWYRKALLSAGMREVTGEVAATNEAAAEESLAGDKYAEAVLEAEATGDMAADDGADEITVLAKPTRAKRVSKKGGRRTYDPA